MERILYLAHRIPYPPNKGDKIRSYHVLRYLAERYQVYLGAFVDDPRDWRHAETLQRWCRQCRLLPLSPRRSRLRSLQGLITGAPLTLPYYRDARMADWVRRCVTEQGIDTAFVFSSSMAQYLDADEFAGLRRVIDFVDVDSDKWEQYGRTQRWPMSWVYRREGRRLDRYERRIAQHFDASMFVSAEEAALFAERVPAACNIGYYDNGVDWAYFTPRPESDSPYEPGARVLVFTGAMDYWANADAVSWFAGDILPAVREQVPDALFAIVGARPTEAVKRLERLPGVRVTGAVEDIRPYLEHAHAAVAPLRIARGVQNKVLEAMAMARPVIASPQALDGIDYPVGEDLQRAETDEQFAAAAVALLRERRSATAARDWIRRRYDWNINLSRLQAMLDPEAAHAGDRPVPGAAAGI
ncbi:TIGR03087 family PEP-CTERM/XrtA system glycosyltransferase [Thiohalobacter thiocyanaticus]|uniref:TIGR03087 family PEP-CTERM/XrtA system glycosyltransferase n=1 Tax=Thiohalobacter thiocyanaticus TaxID=585455 RepID=A0A426QM78_9GAMM|nr:TIGR03087 family PEP-CTERM/XrtA system glycosyltransferase [Thiohalobacter thiocyanaticus]RRQ22827.1 TIGR03087 family PEP-CTERM/XrtA system glycosyltransferase [Thiohalobacter thiocyanaticus]